MHLGQRGFTLLEVLITVTVLGILAAVAVPRFETAIAMANTAKIKADLQTLDTAVAMYTAEHGTQPQDYDDLKAYITDFDQLHPPKGQCILNDGSLADIKATEYVLEYDATANTKRATCDSKKVYQFGRSQQ